ncbi:zinc ribbon domain-containing protein [Candidatus Bathyarchaeota archaeon]|jgi:hypothetical protein|nr:MAG: zinc ribbon domain-containing protein [Candidatus Bathyarchaeota archaeon]
MSDTRLCKNCGAAVEDGVRFCSECGADQNQQEATTVSSTTGNAYTGTPRGGEKRAIDHITIGYTVAFEQPMVFLPSVISGILGLIVTYGLNNIWLGDTLNTLIGLAISMVSFILSFGSLDMSRDAYYKQPLDLMESIGYVTSRFVVFFIAAIFGGLLSITIVFIPIVLFMFVIMVIDETGIMDAFQKSINVIKSDLVDVLMLIVLSIVASFVIGYVPFISTLLNAVVNVIIAIAFIDIYVTYKAR